MKKAKNKKWIKLRHRIVRNIAYHFMYTYSKLTYGIKIDKFKDPLGDRQYIILFNHQTAFDQFFVGMAFKNPIYYMASEDIFSNGWISSLIKYLVAPIPIKKQTTDIRAVMNCIKVVKEGGSIAIAPEGNRTYSGKTEYMNPAIAPLIKKLDIPLVLYRLEGGYGVQPRWSDKLRKGKMRGYVHKVIEPKDYMAMSDKELYETVKKALYVNEAVADKAFHSNKSAEYLERAIYVCPDCKLAVFETNGDIIECQSCKKQIRYLPTKELEGIGFEFPFKFVNDWYEFQNEYINSSDVTKLTSEPIFTDIANVSEVIVYKNKKPLLKDVKIALYGDRIQIADSVYPFEKTSAVTVLGRNKLNIYFDGKIYQLKGGKRFNALKYVNIFHRYKNIISGENNVKFLGL